MEKSERLDKIRDRVEVAKEVPASCAWKMVYADDAALLLAEVEQLRQAAEDMMYHYIDLVESGDCGNWKPLDEGVVKRIKGVVAGKGGI